MRAAEKKKSLTTVLPDSAITSTKENKTIIENDQLTVKVKCQKLQNKICKLKPISREWTDYYSVKDSGNQLINWHSLNTLMRCNMNCARCGGDVMLQEKMTTGIATSVYVTCKNQQCNLNKSSKINRMKFMKYNFWSDSNESFAINWQLVLSLIQMEYGYTEADMLLMFLELLNMHTFHTKTFTWVSNAIRWEINEISNKSMQDATE